MSELLLKNVEPAILARLKERAEEHGRSVEDEHRAILQDALLKDKEASTVTFEEYLRKMPDVGTDADFSRIEGTIRDIDLAD